MDHQTEALQQHQALLDTPDDHPARQWIRAEIDSDDQKVIERWGLGWGGDHGWWQGRVMFPYVDMTDTVPGMTGRALKPGGHDNPKWRNTATSMGFLKDHELWGLDSQCAEQITATGACILVEGPKDVIRVRKHNPDAPCVAPVGVSFSAHQARLLWYLGAENVVVLPDNDAGGEKMCRTVARVAKDWPTVAYWDHRRAIPRGKDPAELTDEQLEAAIVYDEKMGRDPKRLMDEPTPKRIRPMRRGTVAKTDGGAFDGDTDWEAVVGHRNNDVRDEFASRGVQVIGVKASCPHPDHANGDRNPSMTVTDDWWYCHGCARGGSIIDILMHFDGMTRPQASKEALNRAGIATAKPVARRKGARR